MTPAIGFALRDENRHLSDDVSVDALEITFERADDPLRTTSYLELERGHVELVSVHALKLSPASPDPPADDYLDRLVAIADENGAVSISDHLGFTRESDDGVDMGHFAAPPFTQEALDVVSANVEHIQRGIGARPFFLENVAYLFRLKGKMNEDEFFSRLLARTGCGWLCDVANLHANALNHGYDARAFLDRVMPEASRVQIHLAGGHVDPRRGIYVDSHSSAIPGPVWSLYAHALQLAGGKVEAVFVERDQNFPSVTDWRDEMRKVRRVAECVESGSC